MLYINELIEKLIIWGEKNSENIVVPLFAIHILNTYFLDGKLVFITTTNTMLYLSKFIDMAIYFIAMLCVFIGKYTKKEICIILAGYILMLLVVITTGEIGLFGLWTFIILAGKVPYDKWIRPSLYCHCIGISAGVIATLLGIHQDSIYGRSILSTRYSFGLGQPNFTGSIFFLIAACYCWLKKEKLRIRDYLLLTLITVVVYVFMNSQGTTIVLAAFIFLTVLFQKVIRNKETIRKGLLLLFILSLLCAVTSLILSIINVTDIPFLAQVDELLSHRFSHVYRTLKIYDFSLFGQKIDFAELNAQATLNGERAYYMDCMWVYLPVHYGIVFSIFFVYAYFSAMHKFVKKEEILTVIIFFCGSLYAMEQRIGPYLFGWVFIIFLAEKLFRSSSSDDKFYSIIGEMKKKVYRLYCLFKFFWRGSIYVC